MVKRFDAAALYDALDTQRERREMTWRQLAEETLVSESTIRRIRLGGRMEVDGMLNLVAWLHRPVEDFVYDSDA